MLSKRSYLGGEGEEERGRMDLVHINITVAKKIYCDLC